MAVPVGPVLREDCLVTGHPIQLGSDHRGWLNTLHTTPAMALRETGPSPPRGSQWKPTRTRTLSLTHTHIQAHIYIHAFMHMGTHGGTHVHTCTYTWVPVHTYMYMLTHTRTHLSSTTKNRGSLARNRPTPLPTQGRPSCSLWPPGSPLPAPGPVAHWAAGGGPIWAAQLSQD